MQNTFPIYRKLEGFNRFYKIESADLFIEISIRNGIPHSETIQAIQFPEKLRIQDMIAFNFNYVEMSEEEIANYFN
ncbi:hypothetical protein [Fluviicola taffensis]|uniref:Uncharacterized protein n=1 Tax=Fluviicola taffensis (strain DSM 16823 / NCIMB 13979 / RW262) TaxID=755732 RepID=F2IFS8_FLUTR|nr:hypothetical protein [Fluviicola taffensis]AEA42536.1 hypothetical protein Fluta_0531 [Fluviicola taffensis DSM 16823]